MSDPRLVELMHAMLDGTIDEEGAAELSRAMEAEPTLAPALAQLAILHDALHREHHEAAMGRASASRMTRLTIVRRWLAAAAVLAVAGLLLWTTVSVTPTASAQATLARLAAAARTGDRTYFIEAIADDGRERRGRRDDAGPDRSDDGSRRGRGKADSVPIDGAVLVVRDPGQYVLRRTDADGRPVVTGCDGRTAWIVPAEGAVRVSGDLKRFSGALPGSRFELPFLNPHEGLAELAAHYDVLELKPTPALGHPMPRLIATRRSDARGGPKSIEIEFDPATAVIHTMRMDHLPQARGGPRSVEFTLADQLPRTDGFFSHDRHHDPSRPVLAE